MRSNLSRFPSASDTLRRSALSIAIGCALGLSPVGAFAQSTVQGARQEGKSSESSDALEEIVVTAQRREESLQSVPIAVTAITSDQLTTSGITGLGKLTDAAIPGLTAVPFAASPTITSFNIRGISTADPQAGLADSGVAVYIDGIVLGRAAGNSLDFIDAQRIEILRGPQGTLFGRNAEGGAIQYISKRPTGELGGNVEGSLGNYDLRRLVAHLDLPKFANVSVKLSGMTSKHDGYVKNAPLGPFDSVNYHDDLGLSDQQGWSLGALWQPTENFDSYYTYDYGYSKSTIFYAQRTGGRTPSEPSFCQNPNFAAVCATPGSLAANVFTGTQQPQPDRVDQTSVPLYIKPNTDRTQGHSLILSWRPDDSVELKSLTGYRKLKTISDFNFTTAATFIQTVPTSRFDGLGGNDVPAGTPAGISGGYASAIIDQHQFSQELQVIGSTERFHYTGGLYYFTEQVKDTRDQLWTIAYTYLGQPGVLTPILRNPFPLQTSPTTGLSRSLQVYDAKATSAAAYFQGTYTPPVLGDRLNITAGVRYSRDTKEHTRLQFLGNPDGTVAPKFKHNRIDPAVTLAYQIGDNINSYLRYATAYRAGGTWIRNQGALTTYDPENVVTWEAGFKTDWLDQRLRWNVAIYRNSTENYQASVQNVNGNPSSTNIKNVPNGLTFTGIENELAWKPVSSVLLGLSYAYQHADVPATLQDFTGNQLPFRAPNTPKDQVSASIDWSIPISGLVLTPHVDYSYQSKFYVPATTYRFTQANESLVSILNARLTLADIAVGSGANLSFSLWGRNLLEPDNFSFTFAAPTSDFTVAGTPGGTGSMGPPRTFGVDVRLTF